MMLLFATSKVLILVDCHFIPHKLVSYMFRDRSRSEFCTSLSGSSSPTQDDASVPRSKAVIRMDICSYPV